MAISILNTAGTTVRYDEQIAGVFPTLASLKLVPGAATADWTKGTAVAILIGATAAWDQATKVYTWDPDLTTAGNDTTIVQPTAITGSNPGRWRSP